MKRLVEKSKKLVRCALELLSLAVFTPIGRLLRLLSPKWRNIWLISERGYEARDNALHLFRYMVSEHKEINAVFMIDKHSADLDKVARIGPVVYRSSLRHRLTLGAANRLVSTHIMGYTPDIGAYFRLDKLKIVPGIKAFLQHGVIKDDMPFLHYPTTRCDLFVTTAKGEYEYIRDNFGHADGVVRMLGLCRYDALYTAPPAEKRQILLMPTWREWLALHDAGDFTQTDYYKAINGFINSPRLRDMLDKYDYELAFYPHYEMQRFLPLFSCDCPRVKIHTFQNSDVQRLLIESRVLVTDFSSVFIDFAYMGKPEVFFQFDEAEFRKRQYKESFFSYRHDAFGPVSATLEDTLDSLQTVLDNGCKMAAEYEKRLEGFFTFRDDQNCRRNYEAIASLNKHKE